MKKFFSKTLVTVLALALTASLTACGGSAPQSSGGSAPAASSASEGGAAPSAEKTSITLRIGSGHSESNPWIAALEDFFVKNVSERVENETDYSIEWVKSYGGSVISLGNELEGVESGLVDIGCTILVFEASRLPLQTMVYSMPFSCPDPIVAAKVYEQLLKEYPQLATDYETKYNQKYLGLGVCDQYGFYSKKEVTSLSDISGAKIGAAGINLAWIEGSGAVGVQTSLNDTYQNLQTSVCDATIQPTHSCINLKVYEVAPYYLDANFNALPFNAITVNMDSWNSLPAEVQQILVEVGEGYLEYESEYISKVHAEDLAFMEANGVKVATLGREEQIAWAASLADIVNGAVKRLDESGYPGAEIVGRYYELLEENGIQRVRDWVIE